jgi:hypothetical protein
MTKLLEQALAELKTLPEREQDAIAARILEEILDERRWQKSFAESPEVLKRLAAEALEEDRQGKTLPGDW